MPLVLMFSLLACTKEATEQAGAWRALLPWMVSPGRFELREVPLKTLPSPFVANGPAARVFIGRDDEVANSIARPDVSLSGTLVVPKDPRSSVALAAYANLERLLVWDQTLGVSQNLTWPRSIALFVEANRPSIGGRDLNGARYAAETDQIYITPYSLKRLSLGLNPGVIAHEHFHAYFQRMVLDHLPLRVSEAWHKVKEGDRFSNETMWQMVLRAWNEGMADFYSYSYSLNPRMLDASFSQPVEYRHLDAGVITLPNHRQLAEQSLFPSRVGCEDSRLCLAYYHGAMLSRALYGATQARPEATEKARAEAQARELFKMLKALPQALNALQGEVDFSLPLLLLYRGKTLTLQECRFLNQAVEKSRMLQEFPQCG